MAVLNKCGFDKSKDCTAVCIYYRTCTRNPEHDKLREGKQRNGRKVFKDHGRSL